MNKAITVEEGDSAFIDDEWATWNVSSTEALTAIVNPVRSNVVAVKAEDDLLENLVQYEGQPIKVGDDNFTVTEAPTLDDEGNVRFTIKWRSYDRSGHGCVYWRELHRWPRAVSEGR